MANDDFRLLGLENVKPYELLGSEDLYDMPAPKFIIEDFLPEASISGLTSYPGVGKTWLAFEMTRALATGGLFLNKFPAHEGAVLFLGSDASVADYARQWRRLTLEEFKKLQPDDQSPLDYVNPLKENVRFLCQSDFLFENRDACLRLIKTSGEFVWGDLHEEFDEATGQRDMVPHRGFSLIIYDTLSKLTRANQNDNSQMEEVFRNIRLISERTGASAMILHHNAKSSEFKDGEDWRGAMAQIGALDNWFQVTPTASEPDVIQVKVKKFRGITPPSFFYKADVNNGDMAEEPPATLVAVEEPKNERLDDALATSIQEFMTSPNYIGKSLTLKQIADALAPQYLASEMGDQADMALFHERTKFETALRNRLKSEARKAKPVIKMYGGGSRGRRSTFSAIMEQALSEDKNLKVKDES